MQVCLRTGDIDTHVCCRDMFGLLIATYRTVGKDVLLRFSAAPRLACNRTERRTYCATMRAFQRLCVGECVAEVHARCMCGRLPSVGVFSKANRNLN